MRTFISQAATLARALARALALALALAVRRARDAAGRYHRAQPPRFRTACRAPFSGFPT